MDKLFCICITERRMDFGDALKVELYKDYFFFQTDRKGDIYLDMFWLHVMTHHSNIK